MFYRVNYDAHNWQRLTSFLRTKSYEEIDPINRAQLIDDSFNLARANYLEYSVALDLTLYMYKEVHYTPWKTLSTVFDHIAYMLAGQREYEFFSV